MHRSGSTLVWQISRHLVDGHPGLRNPRGVSTAEYPAAAANADDLLMAKVHFRPALNREDFPDEGARYLYTYRDPRDVVASLFRKARAKEGDPERGARNSRLIVRRELRGDEFWTNRKDVWIGRYEDFRDDVPGLVRALAAYLEIPVDDARVEQIVRDVDLAAQEERARIAKESGIDDNLRVTSNHITDGREGAWRDTLTHDELVAIEGESARWLVEHGYAVETPVGKRKTADLTGHAPVEKPVGSPAGGRHAQRQARQSIAATQEPALSPAAAPLLAAAAFAGVAFLSRHRNPTSAALLWTAAAVGGAAAAYRMGQDGTGPAEVLSPLLSRLRRRVPGSSRQQHSA